MSHRYHPDSKMNDNPNAMLFDHCLDCDAHAENLGMTLDKTRWPTMFSRMLVTEMPRRYGHIFPNVEPGYFSDNERKLGRQMYYMFVVMERQHIYEGSTMYSILATLTTVHE